jgi:hypothetical protein
MTKPLDEAMEILRSLPENVQAVPSPRIRAGHPISVCSFLEDPLSYGA